MINLGPSIYKNNIKFSVDTAENVISNIFLQQLTVIDINQCIKSAAFDNTIAICIHLNLTKRSFDPYRFCLLRLR